MVNACFDLQDEPLRMLSFFSLYCFIRDVALHIRIVFIGDVGNEIFWVTAFHRIG